MPRSLIVSDDFLLVGAVFRDTVFPPVTPIPISPNNIKPFSSSSLAVKPTISSTSPEPIYEPPEKPSSSTLKPSSSTISIKPRITGVTEE